MLLSHASAKVLNFSEDAHIKTMSTFETDEHLRALVSWTISTLVVQKSAD
jgi:hypothetical protein